MKNDIIGIILQPISNIKEPWNKYDKRENFLDYFQNIFQKEIGNDFYVRHHTEEFGNYFLIPYYTDNKKCFGAYYIDYGKEIKNNYYTHTYHINYSKSFNFLKETFNYEIIEELEFNACYIEKISNESRTFYYKINNINELSKKYITNLLNTDPIS